MNAIDRTYLRPRSYAAILVVAGFLVALAVKEKSDNPGAAPPPVAAFKLPPLPNGVAELKFGDFFKFPVGPLGLDMTDRLRNLDGKRVRMLGYMVRNESAPAGKFMFTAMPVQIHDHDSILADDLPPATVFVDVPTCPHEKVPFTPGMMLLTGTLSVGGRDEPDGRTSLVRLALDPPMNAPRRGKGAAHPAVPRILPQVRETPLALR